jgi:hypothetical protein
LHQPVKRHQASSAEQSQLHSAATSQYVNPPRRTLKFFRLATSTLGSLLILTTFAKHGHAQTPPSDAQLRQQFSQGFLKGCLNGKTPGVKNQRGYCNCLDSSYQTRYDGRSLAMISQLAGAAGNQGPALVNLMMAPETNSCRASNK